jgi:hypothetical protein
MNSTIDLGGPGVACSAMRVRRLLAGELPGDERARVQSHFDGCERCRATGREIALERERLLADVPFETFAAGVAEKLAESRVLRPSFGRRLMRAAPLAIAATLLVLGGAPIALKVLRGDDGYGTRTKGGAGASLFVQDAQGTRELAAATVVAPGAKLLVNLKPGGRAFAAVVLAEPGELSVIYEGPAKAGPLPESFEWTGKGRAELVIIYADDAVHADALRSRLASGKPVEPDDTGADVVTFRLRRD